MAQLAEFLRRSEHARGDASAQLLAEMEVLAPSLGDPDFDELVALLLPLRPMLEALTQAGGPIEITIDALRRGQVELLWWVEELERTQEEQVRRALRDKIECARAEILRLEAELKVLVEDGGELPRSGQRKVPGGKGRR